MGCSVVEVDPATHLSRTSEVACARASSSTLCFCGHRFGARGNSTKKGDTPESSQSNGTFTCFMKYIIQTFSILHFYAAGAYLELIHNFTCMGGQWCGIPGVGSGQQNASGMRDILHIMLHMSFCLQHIFLMALWDTLLYLLNFHLCLGKMSNVWPICCVGWHVY